MSKQKINLISAALGMVGTAVVLAFAMLVIWIVDPAFYVEQFERVGVEACIGGVLAFCVVGGLAVAIIFNVEG